MDGMEPGRSFRWLTRVDVVVNRAFGSKHNPLYHSGAVTVALLLVVVATGVYLLLFYRLGAPYESVARLHGQAWSGRWVRGVHRLASDAALVAAGVHAVRMYAQRRSWGARALAWVSGVVLVAVILVSGWTGYVLVWDTHAQLLAVEGARLLDAVPLFSEPLSRSFSGERELPSAFFFVNLFAHIALPLSLCVLVWVHVARVSRPVLLPSRRVMWGVVATLLVAVIIWPVPLGEAADPLRTPAGVPLDWFYGFWLPVTQRLPAGVAWVGALALTGLVVAVPWLSRPRTRPAPAVVNERTCTGCEQCVADCPYDAIEMVARESGREGAVARVRTELCTSCGICAGSCPPMAIGLPAASGRDQLAEVRSFLARERPGAADVVLIGCAWSAAAREAERLDARLLSVPCVGALHTSAVEVLLRGGAGGVLVVGCPEHDGRTREGVTWTEARLFAGRRSELKPRVGRERVRLVQAALGEGVRLHAAVTSFRADINDLAVAEAAGAVDVVALCRNLQKETVEAP